MTQARQYASFIALCVVAFGQNSPKFEVASIRPVPHWPAPTAVPGERGGGGCHTAMKIDQGRVDFRCTNLAMLIGYAFRFPPDRITGPPWMMSIGSPRFDIAATIPVGAAKNQVPEMFQELLADRFNLVLHHATANLPAYALVVAKGGVNIKEVIPQLRAPVASADSDELSSADAFYGDIESRASPSVDGDSGPVTILSNSRMGTVRQTGDPYTVQRWNAADISAEGLAELLNNVAPLSLPVLDRTGLDGRYRLVLEVSLKDLRGARLSNMTTGEPADDMETIVLSAFNSGLARLGLRLERRKLPVETIVVDRVQKAPTEN